jgi:hypothetical protein
LILCASRSGRDMTTVANAILCDISKRHVVSCGGSLDRTQPGLPLKKGRAGTMTHDYKRNGTTTLFAASAIACSATGIRSSSGF